MPFLLSIHEGFSCLATLIVVWHYSPSHFYLYNCTWQKYILNCCWEKKLGEENDDPLLSLIVDIQINFELTNIDSKGEVITIYVY